MLYELNHVLNEDSPFISSFLWCNMLTWICWSRFNLKLFVKASCMIFFYDDIWEFFYLLLDSHSCMISLKDANRLFIIMFLVSMVWTDLHLSHILGIPHEIHEQRQRINLDSQPTLAFCRLLYTTWTDLYWHSLDWFLFFLFLFLVQEWLILHRPLQYSAFQFLLPLKILHQALQDFNFATVSNFAWPQLWNPFKRYILVLSFFYAQYFLSAH